ncbi:hypothetical protein DENSPDRAFT_885458 [Dentipellis sp. KUC8613]|nr:hypothetical protein DENSPDRAFT_885458 [Dentipellis sp. KUC8613]
MHAHNAIERDTSHAARVELGSLARDTAHVAGHYIEPVKQRKADLVQQERALVLLLAAVTKDSPNLLTARARDPGLVPSCGICCILRIPCVHRVSRTPHRRAAVLTRSRHISRLCAHDRLRRRPLRFRRRPLCFSRPHTPPPASHVAAPLIHRPSTLTRGYFAPAHGRLAPACPRRPFPRLCRPLLRSRPAPPSSDHVVLHLAVPSRASPCLRAVAPLSLVASLLHVAPLSHVTPLSHVAPLPPSSHSFCAGLARPRAPQRRCGHAATRRHVCGRDGAHICGREMAGSREMELLGAGVRPWAREA